MNVTLKSGPTRRFIPIETIVRKDELQMRADPHIENHVEQLREYLRAGGKFEPCEVVTDNKTVWLTDGWLRIRLLEEEDRGQVECEVFSGNFLEARFRALSANSRHGQSRTERDCRKAIYALIETPELLDRARRDAVGTGGLHRSIARACGVSQSTVARALESKGQRVYAGDIAARPSEPLPQEHTQTEEISSFDDEPDGKSYPATKPPRPEPTPEQRAAESVRQAGLYLKEFIGILADELIPGPLGRQLRKAAKARGESMPEDVRKWKPLTIIQKVIASQEQR